MSLRNQLILITCILGAAGYAYWKLAIPVHRVDIRSELIMLGDLDGDRRWTAADLGALDAFHREPFATPVEVACRLDMNWNGLIDEEDLEILRMLVASAGDPYSALETSRVRGIPFPRPRELYRYVQVQEYRERPMWALAYPHATDSGLKWLAGFRERKKTSAYETALENAIYSEAVRFEYAWRHREPRLLPIEREYAARKIARVQQFHDAGDKFELLLALIELVEDAETLTTRNQPQFPIQLLAFRDHLREVLGSTAFKEFEAGLLDWRAVLGIISAHMRKDLGLTRELESLARPRSFDNLENYVQRTEWQYYKSTTRESEFRALINFAQNDRRYLHAVSRTQRRLQDQNVENHNLPMVLLFREALSIKKGDKKKAVGLLDEAIRIPYAWVSSIPRAALPSSLALDNFLLPGNKEDGADKSRHWNVFGGICLYKSPQEALDLSLRREMQDLREGGYSRDAMREFLRDMIANLNGMYHVITVNPELLREEQH